MNQKSDCYAMDLEKEDIETAIKRVGLNKYFRDIFCYREIGYPKPSKDFFNAILSKLAVQKEEVLMTRDDLKKDVKSAIGNEIDAILYDPENSHKHYRGKKSVI